MSTIEAKVVGWATGRPAKDGWLGLTVTAGDITVYAKMPSDRARQLALAILESQGEHLKYDPPNPDMTEIRRKR